MLRVSRADAAVVEDDDLDRELIAAGRFHLHAGEADRRVARDRDDRLVGMHHRGGDGEAHADAHRAVAAGIEPVPRLRIERSEERRVGKEWRYAWGADHEEKK